MIPVWVDWTRNTLESPYLTFNHYEMGDFTVTGRHLATGHMPDLDFLKEEKLNRSVTFRELRSQVERHFAKDQDSMHPEKSPRWRSVLYNSLLTCLREVAFTTDGEEQGKMLKRVQKWYLRKTNRAVSAPRGKRSLVIPETTQVYSFAKGDLKASPSISKPERSESPIKSPITPLPVREKDSPKPFLSPQIPAVIDEARIMSRLHDYQHRKIKEIRSILVEKREVERWSLSKSRQEANSSFCTEQLSRRSPIDRNPAHILEPVDLKMRSTDISPAPLLVDLRNDFTCLKGNKTVTVASAKDRVTQFRLKHSKLLQLSEESPSDRRFPVSLAFYRSKKEADESVEVRRPMTPAHPAITQTAVQVASELSRSLSPLRKAKLVELVEVKRKLAQANLPCTYRVLIDGLMEPGDLPAHMLTPQSLPQGGEMLHSNPFFTFGNKKKGKVKRKK